MPKRAFTTEKLIAETDTDVDTARLGKLIEQRLPEIDLPELLIEVDGWTDFSDHLAPLSGNRSRSPDMPCVLYAAIIAQATNLGLTGMSRASDFSYQQLEWACEQYCREQTLTTASACLVDYHHQLLSRLQSSSRRNPLARALQEYGRLIKTNFILAWLIDEQLRQRCLIRADEASHESATALLARAGVSNDLRHTLAPDEGAGARAGV